MKLLNHKNCSGTSSCVSMRKKNRVGSATKYISFLKKKFYCSITVVCLFSPSLHPTPAEPISLPHLYHPPWFCPCVLYGSSCNPLSPLSRPLSPLSRPHSPLAIVRLFLTSMSLVIFCLLFSFVDYVPVKGFLKISLDFTEGSSWQCKSEPLL